jgi:Flp pilus assembly protein TadG
MKRLLMNSKGQVLVLVGLFLLVLVLLAALAIDLGVAYGVRAKLSAALDAAAIAAGRVIGQGQDVAKEEAKKYFRANFRDGVMGAKAADPEVTADNKADGSWAINVNTTATVPTFFARLAGAQWKTFTVKAVAETTVRTLDMMLVLDTSTSLQPGANPLDPTAFAKLQDAAIRFVGNFDSRNDRIGLIHFASGVVVDVPISDTKGFDASAIQAAIKGLTPAGQTSSAEALRVAKLQLDTISSGTRSDMRAIVFFSDGVPNTVAATFASGITGNLYSETFKYSAPGPYCTPVGSRPCTVWILNQQDHGLGTWKYPIATLPTKDYTDTINLSSDFKHIRESFTYDNTICNVNMAARNMTENIANAARDEKDKPIYMFTIGLGQGLTIQQFEYADDCLYDKTELGGNVMKRLANVRDSDTYNPKQPSGIYAFAAKSSDLDRAFNEVVSFILRLSK